jgi:hypothetical protein
MKSLLADDKTQYSSVCVLMIYSVRVCAQFVLFLKKNVKLICLSSGTVRQPMDRDSW